MIDALYKQELRFRDKQQVVDLFFHVNFRKMVNFFGEEEVITMLKDLMAILLEPLIPLFQRCEVASFVAVIGRFSKQVTQVTTAVQPNFLVGHCCHGSDCPEDQPVNPYFKT